MPTDILTPRLIMLFTFKALLSILLLLVVPAIGRAQFIDNFDGKAIDGWFTMTGDGSAQMSFVPQEGFARIQVDATKDRHNVWWALIKRDVTAFIDVAKLQDPAYELRVEARVRPSHAPRRVNFMINTQRTRDFHQHLREYDLADTTGWHTISMTTKDLDVVPGDTVFVQLAATDWGHGKYHLDVDYYRADVVRRDSAGPDKGEPLIYHPPVPEVKGFSHHLPVTHDSVVNPEYPDVNFNDWHMADEKGGASRVLTVQTNQSVILRWNPENLRNLTADGAGILELTTYAVAKGGNYVKAFGEDLGIEFGKIRVIEILGGDPAWDQQNVTYNSLLHDDDPATAFNTQMISDLELSPERGSKTYVTLSRPVMQRLLDGRTKGIVIQPLGALSASIYASEGGENNAPKLHFNTAR